MNTQSPQETTARSHPTDGHGAARAFDDRFGIEPAACQSAPTATNAGSAARQRNPGEIRARYDGPPFRVLPGL